MIWVFSFFLVGLLVQNYIPDKKKWIKRINSFIMYLPLPAVTIVNISKLHVDYSLLYPIITAWALYVGAFIFFGILFLLRYIDKKTFACLTLVCGLGNTSFIGYPLITVLLGKEQLQHAILVDQPGTFLALSTIGIVTASIAQKGSFSMSYICKRLFSFPPFLAFCIGILAPKSWYELGFQDLKILDILNTIGTMLIPFALLSLGLQFTFKKGDFTWKEFSVGIAYKTLLGPLIFFTYLMMSVRTGSFTSKDITILLELAMPPMITASIVADEFELRPELANALAILGIPFGIIAVVAWWYVISL